MPGHCVNKYGLTESHTLSSSGTWCSIVSNAHNIFQHLLCITLIFPCLETQTLYLQIYYKNMQEVGKHRSPSTSSANISFGERK